MMLVAPAAADMAPVLRRLSGCAAAWVLVLRHLDDAARDLKRTLEEGGHDCLLVHADFRDPSARLQAIAIARDFAGAPTLIWDCGSRWMDERQQLPPSTAA